MAKRAAQGAGTIRKKIVTRNGKQYVYWEARITTGRDPGSGKQIQHSFTGKTQKEVREKMQAAAVALRSGSYISPSKMTLAEWLDIWSAEYFGDLKPNTVRIYNLNIRKHIKPALGAIKLTDLHPHMIQNFINSLDTLSPASVQLVHKVLHKALAKAVQLEYIGRNPSDNCVLPKIMRKEVEPLTDQQVDAIVKASKGTSIEYAITTALFTGMRISELLGLTWDCVNFRQKTLTVNKQLRNFDRTPDNIFISPKNGRSRSITPAACVMAALRKQHSRQSELQLRAGPLWHNDYNLVFTEADGAPLDQEHFRDSYKELLEAAQLHDIRFHDLRHTYAVNSIRAGDDIKTIQGNLGHASAAFTLDKYGHFTAKMRQESAERMDTFIAQVLNL